MLKYRERTVKAKEIAIHYAKQLADENTQAIVAGERDVKNNDEAIALSIFFWAMLDQSVLDAENGVEVEGENNIQFWVEKLMNIFHGHLEEIGYVKEWDNVCDKQ